MLKFKRKLLAAALALSIVLSSGVVWSETADEPAEGDAAQEEDAAQEGDQAPEENAEASGEEEEAPLTEEEALAAMTLYAEVDNLKLYVNEEICTFAVENTDSGYIWWSTPYDYESDPIAAKVQKHMMASTLTYKPLDVENGTLVNTTSYSYETSVQPKKFKIEKVENGVKFCYNLDSHNFYIPVSIVLEKGGSVLARIHTDEISEWYIDDPEIYRPYEIITLNLLQSFGAGRADENGYIFVPDGCGAAINFNNGKTSTQVYQAEVYGEDLAISKTTAGTKHEQTYLPIYGIMKDGEDGDNAMLAVAVEGDACATVNASVNGQAATSINSAWFNFEFRADDTYTMGTKTPLNVFRSGGVRLQGIAVRYYLLSGDELNAADLADTYRNYLINEKDFKKQSEENSNALYLTTMGGTIKKQSILGFPVDMQTVATSYKQAQEIVEKLKELGVDDMVVIYNDFNDCGVTGKISDGVNYSGKLGGKNDFEALYGTIKENNFLLYPSVDIMEYVRSGYGYSFTLNSAKRISHAYATQTAFELAYGLPDTDVKPSWTILSPYYWPDLFRKLTESFTAEGINTISLSQATSVIYSDFGRTNFEGKEHFLREDSMKLLVDGYKKLNDAGISIMAQECNAYALPYVSAITNVPLYSSNYDLFDYDIPFYQMLIHGYIPYSSKPVNASSNADELRLLSILSGAGIHYELMYSEPGEFSDSEYDKYFYSNYNGWLEIAAQDYTLLNGIISSVSDKTITSFDITSPKELAMEYSDGTRIEINMSDMTYSINGTKHTLDENNGKGDEN